MSDITRAEAIDIFKNMLDAWDNYYTIASSDKKKEAVKLAIDSLEVDEAYQLEYERVTKKGTWQQINKNEVNVIPQWKCSECGAEFQCHDMDFEYCPRCGARMEDSDD